MGVFALFFIFMCSMNITSFRKLTFGITMDRKNPKRGGSRFTFLKRTPGIFKFVTLPLEIIMPVSNK